MLSDLTHLGWRQLCKRPAISLAAILSLALAIGSCTSVFRLLDALLLRPLPVRNADRLYAMILRGVGPDGSVRDSEYGEYPQFLLMRHAVKSDAELIAASGSDRVDSTFGSDADMERAHRAEEVYRKIRDQIATFVGPITDKRIYRLKYDDNGHAQNALIGSDHHSFGNQPVIAIFKGSDGMHYVCTQKNGTYEAEPHPVHAGAVIDSEDFSALA